MRFFFVGYIYGGGVKSFNYISLIIVWQRQHEVSPITKQKQIRNKRSTISTKFSFCGHQHGRMSKQIGVFDGPASHLVGFNCHWLAHIHVNDNSTDNTYYEPLICANTLRFIIYINLTLYDSWVQLSYNAELSQHHICTMGTLQALFVLSGADCVINWVEPPVIE